LARLAQLEEPIDVLVTDVIMPHTSGISLAGTVMDEFPAVGVVLLSGYTAETLDLERVTTRGAMFVSKPVTFSQLVDAVGRARAARQANPDPRAAGSPTRAAP
jgi:two-component system cell cycle sensor histidine kinase/response regulator CckA